MSKRYISLGLIAVLVSGGNITWAKGVDTETSVPVTTISSKDIENLPGGRDIQQILDLQQGRADAQLDIKELEGAATSSSAQNNSFLTDGVNSRLTDAKNNLNNFTNQISQIDVIKNNPQSIYSPSGTAGVINYLNNSRGDQSFTSPLGTCRDSNRINAPITMRYPKDSINWSGMGYNDSSYYVNDRWQLNDKWSNNLGVRYDSGLPPAISQSYSLTFPLEYNKGGGMVQIDPPQTTPTPPQESILDSIDETPSRPIQNQVVTSTSNPQVQLDAKHQERTTLEQNIRDLEKGLKSDIAKDPMVRQSIEDNLRNAKSQLETVNRDISNLESQPRQQNDSDIIVETIEYTPEELESMTEIPTAEETARWNKDPWGELEKQKQQKLREISSQTPQSPQPSQVSSAPRQQAQGMTKADEEKNSAAFLSLFDANVTNDTFFESYQQYLAEYDKLNEPQRQALDKKMREYYEQQQRAIRIKMEEDQARAQRLIQLNQASQVREEQQAAEKDAMRTEINVMSQQALQGIGKYMEDNAAHDPTILKWVSVGAEMQHQTKKLADSCIRDQFRAEAKLSAIEAWEKAHAAELAQKPYLQLALINMRYAANMLKLDAEKVWLSTKELVFYGFVIDVATIVVTSMAKAAGVAKKLAEEAVLRATLNAARKPTAYVVGEHMVTAAGQGADEAAAAFMGKTGQQAAGQTVVQATGQAAGTSAVGQATGQQVAKATASQVGDSFISPGVKELLGGETVARSFWLKMNILTKGAEAEINRLIQTATELGISKEEINVAGRSTEKLVTLIIEKTGGKIVTFAEARPILEISVRALRGTATQADRQIIEGMVAQAEAKGVNFWDDLARQGTFGDDGFQAIATSDVVAALKKLVTTGTSEAIENTVKLAPGQAEAMAQTALTGALDKTVQLSAEQANFAAREVLEGAFDKTVQLGAQDASAVANTVIDNILDKTVKLTDEQIGRFIGNVVDDVLEKTTVMTQEQALRMADTVVENIVEHAAAMSEKEAAVLAETVIENILDKTVKLSESQIRNFVNHVAEGIADKTVKLIPGEADNLATTIMDNVLKRFTTGAENDAFRLAQTMLDQELAKTVQLAPSQAASLAETIIEKALEKTTILSPGQASGLADTVLGNILNKTTKMSFDEALRLADTVVENILEKSGTLSKDQAAALAETVIERILDKTVILSQQQAASLAETVIGDVMAKTVQLSQREVAELAETVIGDILANTVKLSERQIEDIARTVIDKTLVGTLKLSENQADNLLETVTENILDRMALGAFDEAAAFGSKTFLERLSRNQFITHLLTLTEKEQLQALTQRAGELGIDGKIIDAAKKSTDAAFNLLKMVVEAEGNKIITSGEANQILALSTRVLRNTATEADRKLLQGWINKAESQGLNYFDDLAKQGTVSATEGFQSVATTDVVEALRGFAQQGTKAAQSAASRATPAVPKNLPATGSQNLLAPLSPAYDALGTTLNKSFADNWGLVSSYRYAKLKGDFQGFFHPGDVKPYGESIGLGGPIIVNGLFGREPGVMVYDNSGYPVGSATRQQANQSPDLVRDLIGKAESRSQSYANEFLGGVEFEVARSVSLGVRYVHRSIPQILENTNNLPVTNYSNFTPQALGMPQLGMTPGDIGMVAGTVNDQLRSGITGPEFWAPTHCCGGMYMDEPVFGRSVLEEAAVSSPNDPLYLKAGKKPQAPKKKQSEKLTFIGSAIKIGGVSLGAGEASTRDKGPNIVDQWGLQKVGFTLKSDPNSAWNVIDGQSKNVLIAVIDSGLDMTHPDGPQYIWTNPKEIPDNGKDDDSDGYADDVHGWNFIENTNDLTDKKGHGTFVAGIIAAKTNNNAGIAGINPGAEIMMLKVADHFGQTNSLNIFQAIHYAVDHGARIINISLGAKGVSQLEQLAINYASAKGVLVVVAGGNDGQYVGDYGPASLKRIVSVGALDYEGTVSLISNWGPNISLVAPAEQIYSLYSKDSKWIGSPADRERLYYRNSGTSFSAPIVTGTASLLLAKNPDLSSRQIIDILLNSATPLGENAWEASSGAGVLNAAKALRLDLKAASLTVELTALNVNEENSKLDSVDVFGIVQGNLDNFTVEIGKGKKSSKWDVVAGPFNQRADYNWICRIDNKTLKGSKDWSIRIKATDNNGNVKIAQSAIPSGKK